MEAALLVDDVAETGSAAETHSSRQPAQPLLGAVRYDADAVVLQSRKYEEVFAAKTGGEGGVVSAVAWADDLSWSGSRLRLQRSGVLPEGVPGAAAQPAAAAVCFGDEVCLVTDERLPICQCASTGLLCARPEATGWSVARFFIVNAAGPDSSTGVVCSFDEIRLVDPAGHYLRGMSVPAQALHDARAPDGGGDGGGSRHTEAVVTAAHRRFRIGSAVSALKVLGTPQVHVLCCVPERDKERELLCLVAASDTASASARRSAERFRVGSADIEEDGLLSSAGKVLSIGMGLLGGSAAVALGMEGSQQLPSWTSKKFCAAVMALQTSGRNCPMNVNHMRALTDHAIPEFLLSENSSLERAEIEGMRAEWHFPGHPGEESGGGGGKKETWRKCRTKILYLHGGAFCTCNSRTHRDLLHRFALASQSAILAIDYRRPPEHPCPVAIDDAVRAYRWMLSLGIDPADVYFAGDSAGGALAVSAILALAELGHPLPAGAVLMSPWVDVSDGRGETDTDAGSAAANP